ncbi:aminopeptidase N C-terminal domain-containing protein, partial [Vibrio parahaemolyticus]|uniref:aminopeptidase N C-terminal domain-containing protein n=1 Tax=Vibrio parahaemolyticus TaxID=670 RepID=UPI0021133C02
MRNNAMGYLSELNDSTAHKLMQDQLDHASNMTDRIAALGAMAHHSAPGVDQALHDFYTDFESDALVIDKWFSLQASS